MIMEMIFQKWLPETLIQDNLSNANIANYYFTHPKQTHLAITISSIS